MMASFFVRPDIGSFFSQHIRDFSQGRFADGSVVE